MRQHAASVGLAAWGLVAASQAFGCGHCVEDRIAAVYDHGVVTKALGQHGQVAFFAIEGPVFADGEARRAIVKALASAVGVDSPSLRLSVDSASLSLSYDGKRISPDQIMSTLNRKLAPRRLRVSLLKVMS